MKGLRKLCAGAMCLLLCLLPVCAYAAPVENCPGGCTHQAAVGTTHYDTLNEAVSAAAEGSTVTLLSDATVSGMLAVDKSLTLDLGGKTLTGQKTDNDVFLAATKDITLKNGTVTMTSGCLLRAVGCTVTVEKDAVLTAHAVSPTLQLQGEDTQAGANIYGTVINQSLGAAVHTVSSGSGTCALSVWEDAQIHSQQGNGVKLEGAGALEITGGTIQAAEDAVVMSIAEGKTFEASVTGGQFRSQNGETIVIQLGTDAVAPVGFVVGGTFSKVPTAYMSENCRTTDNGDGTFTVTAEYTVDFQANGGSGTMASTKADRGTTITLPQCAFAAPDGSHFKAWELGGKEYAPGTSVVVNGHLTLTALWDPHTGGKATCEKKAVCEVCGESYGKLAEHDLDHIGAYAATCTSSGMNAHSKCSVCGGRFVDGVKISVSSLTIPAIGHEWQTVEGVAATCESQGLRAYKQCEICGDLRVEGSTVTRDELIIPATGHVPVSVPAIQATCTEAGTQAHEYCSGCGQHFLHGFAVDEAALKTALASHVLSDWQGDESYHWKSCVDCGAVFRLDAHADADLSGSCDDCGAVMEAEKEEAPAAKSGFGWLWLLPLLIAPVIVILLLLKKRKTEKM